jgi:perosamine synthetase
MLGGPRAIPNPPADVEWPVVTPADEEAVLRVLRRGAFASGSPDDLEVPTLESEWATAVGVRHCAGVSSGTAALQLALAALDVGPGDEVVVPAVSMNATAHAVRAVGATPVFADIDPVTFTVDPASVAAVLSLRTAAVMPVHLHGLPADMTGLRALTEPRGIPLVEDAAQAHGATYQGVPTGALGTVGCFSLHPSKNLPSCAEGGLVTTDDPRVHARVVSLRQFGERPRQAVRTYVAYTDGGNHKLSPVAAAFTRSQLTRFDEYAKIRQTLVADFLHRLRDLPGLIAPTCPDDRDHVWHILRFRLDTVAGIPTWALRRVLHKALRAEGVPMSSYQVLPLPAQPAFRGGADCFPVAAAVLQDSLCLQRRHLNPGSGPALVQYADAITKVWEHLPELCDLVTREAA